MRLIDADALRKEIHCAYSDDLEILDHIDAQPPVDAVPVVHGRWETVEDWDGDERYKCSVCGDEWFLEAGNPEFNNMNYCPKCGARMRG